MVSIWRFPHAALQEARAQSCFHCSDPEGPAVNHQLHWLEALLRDLLGKMATRTVSYCHSSHLPFRKKAIVTMWLPRPDPIYQSGSITYTSGERANSYYVAPSPTPSFQSGLWLTWKRIPQQTIRSICRGGTWVAPAGFPLLPEI